MKTRTMVVLTLGLAITAGCKKKDKDQGTTGSAGSAAVKTDGSGSAGSAGSAAVKTEPPPPPPKPAPKTGKDLAQLYQDCGALMAGQKWDEFLKTCAADTFVAHMADDPKEEKRDDIIPMMKDMRTAFPDAKWQPQLIFVNGRHVIAVSLTSGTHEATWKTPMGEVPATKKKYGQLMYQRLAINEENKAAEEWVYFDPSTMWGQLGLSPKEAPPVRPAMEKGMDGAPVIIVAADDDKEKANLETVKKANEAFMNKKSAESMAFYADDAVESDQASAADTKGKKEIDKGMTMFQKAFPDLKMEVKGQWAAGDYVIVEGKFSGTNTGPMGKMPKTGKPVTGEYAEIFKLKDGKITELWRFRNGLAMAMQLGLVKMPAAGGDMKGGDMKGGDKGGDMKGGDKKPAEPAKKGA